MPASASRRSSNALTISASPSASSSGVSRFSTRCSRPSSAPLSAATSASRSAAPFLSGGVLSVSNRLAASWLAWVTIDDRSEA